MLQPAYDQLVALARRATRQAVDAEDCLQEALIEALRAGRDDLSLLANRRWLMGVVRNKARMAARGATRRRGRETDWSGSRFEDAPVPTPPVSELLAGLPPALKAVAALTLTGHNRREIAYLLGLDDAALRQRISALRRRLVARGIAAPDELTGLSLNLAYGRIRDALLPALTRHGGLFASHDPDGHLFLVRSSQYPVARQLDDGTKPKEMPP